ncbi:MAG: hypothetical protein P1U85_17010 [Verrucomicrobiales bacterium]|jgi:hypothetical protein|nr:hypothetical protein [Verrucomicrobiales bacterium]
MSVTIVSICERAEKGISRPFFCEGDDGNFYFLKRENISADQLVIEYVFSRLAEECGLSTAPFELVEVPEVLTRYALVERSEEFVPGISFGSQRLPFADELRTSHLTQVDDETKMRCLCFDWWARNSDRSLGILGGDPNLLWDPTLQKVFLIDHDRCLDPDFDEVEFKREHAFRDVRPFIERKFYEKFRTKFESAIYNLEKIWKEIPEEWLRDESGIDRVSVTRPDIEASLMKPEFPADGILPQ